MATNTNHEALRYAIRASFEDCRELHEIVRKGPDALYEYINSSPKENAAIVSALFSELGMMFRAMGMDVTSVDPSTLNPAEREQDGPLAMAGICMSMASGLMHRVALARVGIRNPTEGDRMDLIKAAISLHSEEP